MVAGRDPPPDRAARRAGPGRPARARGVSGMNVCPMTMQEAKAYIDREHRHHRAPLGGLFAIGAMEGEAIVGVVVVGRPVARMLADGFTCEVTRLATDGSRNACSMLYRAAWRAARAMGYRRLVTYTLPEEGGSSLRGAGFKLIGEAGGGSWSRESRPRVDLHPLQTKLRWELTA
jgi:hypothetical protein